MRHLSKWHYIVIMTVPFGVFLSMQFSLIGLIVFSGLNLAICFRCRDAILLEKTPVLTNQRLGISLKEPPNKFSLITVWALFVLPLLISLGFVWAYSAEQIAGFILRWKWLGIVNQNVHMVTTYMADTSSFNVNLGDGDLRKLDRMKDYYPRLSMFVVLSRLMVYFFLPVLIVITTFDRARDIKATNMIVKSVNDTIFKRIEFAVLLFLLFCLGNYLCSAPYILLFDHANGYEVVFLIIMVIGLSVSWITMLTQCDHIIAKLQFYATNTSLVGE